jgi:hypothetical protein
MGIGLLASLIASLIVGIGARIIMRIVALTAHMPPGFSIEGTLNIVFITPRRKTPGFSHGDIRRAARRQRIRFHFLTPV